MKLKIILLFTLYTFFIFQSFAMDNKKRERSFNTQTPRTKRIKTSSEEDINNEMKIREFIDKNIKENNVCELIRISNYLLKNPITYAIVCLEIISKRYYNHRYLYNFFKKRELCTYSEENLNMGHKTYRQMMEKLAYNLKGED